MREKLLDLMKNEGLKPSQLAELLEINPAGISHILAGRNKPGFDLLQKILRYSGRNRSKFQWVSPVAKIFMQASSFLAVPHTARSPGHPGRSPGSFPGRAPSPSPAAGG